MSTEQCLFFKECEVLIHAFMYLPRHLFLSKCKYKAPGREKRKAQLLEANTPQNPLFSEEHNNICPVLINKI